MSIFGRLPDPRAGDGSKSSWLTSEESEHPGTKECKTCKGSGRSGFVTGDGATIVCGSCRGFGY
jgi:hypothetical protein